MRTPFILKKWIGLFSICFLSCCDNFDNSNLNSKENLILGLNLINADSSLTPSQALGKKLFFDSNLSNPKGQSCASCHLPNHGFAGLNELPVSEGANKSIFGNRNAPTVSYAAFTPNFQFDSIEKNYFGGLFWDGRVNTLSEQAKFPLLNHLEMNNETVNQVVESIKKQTSYVDYFERAYGLGVLNESNENIFHYVTEAIEEFEETKQVSPFNSKFDFYIKGLITLDSTEKRGLSLFNDPKKGNCAACHPSTKDKFSNAILFTDFTYDNAGTPKNLDNPFYKLDKDKNPDGLNYIDYGLGGFLKNNSENGKFKVPTLRNIALTAPYFHNGYFKTLKEVVHFYNARDIEKFPAPEVLENVNKEEMGNLKLTSDEEDAIVAFLLTLTDGYQISISKK
ncbi:MAG: cytochrome-c peroxidase [Bacteroidota bacterium]